MELNLSPSSTQVHDKARQIEPRSSRPVAETDETGGDKAPVEAEAVEARAAPKDGDEEQPRKSAVDSDTGHNFDLSV